MRSGKNRIHVRFIEPKSKSSGLRRTFRLDSVPVYRQATRDAWKPTQT